MKELNISQSAMPLSSGSLHSNERPTWNTCFHMVIRCLEKGKGQVLDIVQQAEEKVGMTSQRKCHFPIILLTPTGTPYIS